jgi:hypothetical protein
MSNGRDEVTEVAVFTKGSQISNWSHDFSQIERFAVAINIAKLQRSFFNKIENVFSFWKLQFSAFFDKMKLIYFDFLKKR